MPDISQISFDSLGLTPTQTLQLVPNTSRVDEVFASVYVGAFDQQAMIISAPPESEFPVLQEGQPVVVRVAMPEGIAVFTTTVLFIAEEPIYMAFLDVPTEIKFHKIRKARRVNVSLPVLASGGTANLPQNIDGKVVDISTTGAGVISAANLANVGEMIRIRGKFRVGAIQRLLSINALVKSKSPINEKTAKFGVEFDNDNEDDLIVLFGFIFNAMAFGNVQEIQ